MLTLTEANDSIQFVNECMKKSIAKKDPDASIRAFLEEAGKLLKAHAIYIYTVVGEGTFDRTFFWREDGCPARPDMQTITEDDFVSTWWDAFHKGQMIIDIGMEKYKSAQPHGYHRTQQAGIQSLVFCPLILDEVVYGLVAYSNVADEYLHDCETLFEVCTNYVAMLMRHRKNSWVIDEVTHYDPVTGLYKLDIFRQSLTAFMEVLTWGDMGRRWDIICFNISQFKVFNNQQGFAAGDALLKDMGQVIHQIIGTDYLTRSEGDRFYCLVEDENAEDIIRRVHDQMERNKSGRVDIYAGIYTLTVEEKDSNNCLDYAKLACESANNDFEHYYRRFKMEMADTLKRNAYIIKHINDAVEKGWIKVYYQPIYNAMSRKVFSFEALARWNDPVNGFLNPKDFISVLENTHLLYKLDLYVLKEACRQIRSYARLGKDLHISVNISRNDLEIPWFHERINSILDQYKVPHDSISIEITESALVNHEEMIQDNIRHFHKDGYQVWLDDFGSGYRSLNALLRIEFDRMKLDMMFLRNANDRTPDIVKDVIDLSKKLGILCLSEGVEKESEMHFLMDLGCCYIQGYYISKPEPIDKIGEILKAKGLVPETRDERCFFADIEHINIMFKADPYIGKGFEPANDPKVVSVLVEDEDSLEIVYSNETGRNWLGQWGIHTDGRGRFRKDEGCSEVFHEVLDGIRQLSKRGQLIEISYHDPFFPGKMRIQLITIRGGRRAFLLTFFRNDTTTTDFNFEDLASGLPGAVFCYKAHGDKRILFANQRCINLFGCSNMAEFLDITHGSFWTLVYKEDIDEVERSIWSQINEPENQDGDYVVYRVICKDGSQKNLLHIGHLINHKVYGDIFFVILFDMKGNIHMIKEFKI